MSCQLPHWTRRNASPALKQRPVRATVPVSLMRQNPGSPTKNDSPPKFSKESKVEIKLSEKTSAADKPTLFLGPRGEKSKTLNFRTQPQQHSIRRTASLDALYLAHQGQSESFFLGYCGRFMIDRATQTPDEWAEPERKKVPWKQIVSSGDQLEVKFIRQKLQRTNQGNRTSSVLLYSQRQSPIQGDHSAISALASSSLTSAYHTAAFGTLHKTSLAVGSPPAASTNTIQSSGPIPIIQGPKHSTSPRLQNSVEGLNQEIEKLVFQKGFPGDREGDYYKVIEPTPEGHRAPIAELFHSIRTSRGGRDSYPSSGNTSRSHSSSPPIPIIPGVAEFSISPSGGETVPKLASPHINQFLSREPPDGCEKVKIMEDPRRHPSGDSLPEIGLSKPEVTYVLLPSQSSAFCPLYKDFKPPPPAALYEPYAAGSLKQMGSNYHK